MDLLGHLLGNPMLKTGGGASDSAGGGGGGGPPSYDFYPQNSGNLIAGFVDAGNFYDGSKWVAQNNAAFELTKVGTITVDSENNRLDMGSGGMFSMNAALLAALGGFDDLTVMMVWSHTNTTNNMRIFQLEHDGDSTNKRAYLSSPGTSIIATDQRSGTSLISGLGCLADGTLQLGTFRFPRNAATVGHVGANTATAAGAIGDVASPVLDSDTRILGTIGGASELMSLAAIFFLSADEGSAGHTAARSSCADNEACGSVGVTL